MSFNHIINRLSLQIKPLMKDPEKTVGDMADNLKTAFIGSVDAAGFPCVKAMLPPRKREGIRRFWFSTNTSSMRVAQFRDNPKACIYFCNRRFFRGVMLRGTMEVLTDEASKQAIWRKGDEQYYPLGVTAPDYCVLRFTAQSGRYYGNFQSSEFEIEEPTL